MRRALACLVPLCLLLGSQSAWADCCAKPPPPPPPPLPTSLIDFDAAGPIFGRLAVELETALGPAVSVVVSPHVGLNRDLGAGLSGAGLMGGLHLFPWASATHGFWTGPELMAGWLTAETAGSGRGFYIQLTVMMGYTFLIADHFSVSAGVGVGPRFSGFEVAGNATTGTYNGVMFAARLGLGYAW